MGDSVREPFEFGVLILQLADQFFSLGQFILQLVEEGCLVDGKGGLHGDGFH